ncbi:hypothetical protein L914_08086 [Phytophthora nicotianae]|uniref:Uncharacterized protein n=1 Tax=Phytophthora nicotianae TaxID=4792 RepID=W2NEW4_PHYNI|nr:hypothetical protein L914_08086 [Phytophthora nicotianae]
MDGSFIPPPFPFPEAWPRIFSEQQQRQERRWLTPMTFAPVQRLAPSSAKYVNEMAPSVAAAAATNDAHFEDDEDEVDGEYEYGYVLSDEWREHFQSSVQAQQLQLHTQKRSAKGKKRKAPQKNKNKQQQAFKAESAAAASASRSGHLQREIESAKTRELARKWKRRGGIALQNPQVAALETSLNALFDEFCDAFQPVVWPHDPLQR